MAFFNTPVAALLLSLSVALSSVAADTPSPAPGPVPFNKFNIPVEEQAKDSQYLKAQLTAAANKVEAFIANEVEKRLSDPAIVDSDKECMLMCKEVYESAVHNLKDAMEYVSAGDFRGASVRISAFSTDILTCNECFDGFHKFEVWASGVGSDCNSKTIKYKTHVLF